MKAATIYPDTEKRYEFGYIFKLNVSSIEMSETGLATYDKCWRAVLDSTGETSSALGR
jgi:hypothetical protein